MTELPTERARRSPGEGGAAPAWKDLDQAIEALREAADGGPATLADLATALARRFWLTVNEEAEESAVVADLTAAVVTLADAVAPSPGKNRLRAAALLGALPGSPDGEETTEALETAVALFSRAAARRDADPAEAAVLGAALAARHERDGLPADRDEAIIWLRRAYDVVVRTGSGSAADLLRLAELLAGRAEQNHDAADATAAIGYAQRCLVALAEDDPDRVFPLYRLGLAHLARAGIVGGDGRDDLEAAIGHLSAALDALPGGHPGHGEVTVYLGLALGAWARLEFGTLPKLRDTVRERADEAVRLIADGMARLPEEDPLRASARFQLAVLRGTRLIALRSGDDEAAVLAALAEVLATPGCPAAAADACHLLSAALPLAEWMPEDVRPGSAAVDLGSFGQLVTRPHVAPPPQDVVEAALAHLDQISEEAAADPEHAVLIAWLRTFLIVVPDAGGVSQESAARAIAELEGGIAASSGGDFGVPETRGLIGALHSLRAGAPEGAENRRRAAESFTTAIEGLPDDHPLREVFLGVLGGAAGIHFEGKGAAQEELNAAVASLEHVLEHLPADHPDRPAVLTRLAGTLVRNLRYARSTPDLDRMRTVLGEALERSADPANKAVNLALLGAIEGFGAMTDADPDRHASAVERLREAAELAPEQPRIQTIVHTALVTLLAQRYMAGGGLEALDAALHYARLIIDTHDENDPVVAQTVLTMEYFRALQPLARYRTDITPGQLDTAIAGLRSLRERLPESNALHGSVSGDLILLQLMRETDGLDLSKAMREPELFAAYADAAEAELNATGGDDVFHALGLSITAFAKVNKGLAQRDRRPVDEGIALLAEACERADLHPAQRYQLLAGHGMALRMRYDVTRDRRDLYHAAARLEEARRHAGQETGADLAGLLYTLGLIYHERDDRQLGDRRASVEAGVAAMREVAGDVILQSGETRALDVAASATGEGVDVARWCLFGGYAETAVEALELGRATVLHAATADAGVPALLRAGGHGPLAAEWEDGRAKGDIQPWNEDAAGVAPSRPGERPQPHLVVPSDLRHRVMRAIEGTEVERRLLAPPAVPEIAGALSAAGADALVYLLPRDHEGGGVALVVSGDGQVRDVALPALAADDGGVVREFTGGGGAEGGPEVLPRLCEWAWTAAMEKVLSAVSAVSAVSGGPRRRPRLVLVPVGELGAVPWHAARRRVAGGGWRYACHDAAISYAASARQFVDARRLPARPWDSAPALVRVGDSGLFYASEEIIQIHRRHYPDGTLLGRRRERDPGRKATAANVGKYLPHEESPGASLLHLGCHALAAPRPVDSRLLLAGGQTLAMTDILRRARERPKDTAGGLVVLAACGSDQTSRHHDEALTLATAFLAAGACGVVGARWEVPDAPTSLFTIMFHHYLNSGYDDPATALRAAQLWMLDPRRRPPAGLDPRLAEEAACLDLTAIDAWAAFTYQGQ